MVTVIIILCLLLLITWILFAPLVLTLDSSTGVYNLRWKGIAKAEIIPLPDDILIQFRVGFWQKQFYPLHYQPKTHKKDKKKAEKPKSQKSKPFRKTFRKIKRVFQSFEVQTFRLNMDTNDYIYNSYLWPICYFLSQEQRQLTINYNGEFELLFIVKNRLFNILFAYLT